MMSVWVAWTIVVVALVATFIISPFVVVAIGCYMDWVARTCRRRGWIR